jgi:hypothetical protein
MLFARSHSHRILLLGLFTLLHVSILLLELALHAGALLLGLVTSLHAEVLLLGLNTLFCLSCYEV